MHTYIYRMCSNNRNWSLLVVGQWSWSIIIWSVCHHSETFFFSPTLLYCKQHSLDLNKKIVLPTEAWFHIFNSEKFQYTLLNYCIRKTPAIFVQLSIHEYFNSFVYMSFTLSSVIEYWINSSEIQLNMRRTNT